jgi:ferredoxin
MASPFWVKTLINKTFSQRFLLSRLTRIPGIGRLFEFALFEGDNVIYLPKDKTIRVNKSLADTGDMVVPSQVLEHFIQESNYHFIMDFCICRDSSHCKDFPINLGCLFLGEAVLGINPKFGRLVSADEALDHVKRCSKAGLVNLIGRNKLDTVWLNTGPGKKLLTICNCCPCCCLWKMLPDINPKIGSKITKMPGVFVSINDQCVGCGTCTQNVCFVDAISLKKDHAAISNDCRGCGRCVDVCPQKAIEIRVENKDFITDSIEQISDLVDLL